MMDQALLTELQYALLEPVIDGGQSFLSEIWTRDEVLDAVNAGERAILRQAQLLVTRTEIPVAPVTTAVTLPNDWLATLHLVWRDVNGRQPLAPVDTTEIDLANPSWESVPDRPQGYLDADTETLQLRLGPVPSVAGTIELLYVAVPTAVNGNGRSFTVPDEYLSGVKYDALATLLSKVGRLQDPQRAAYCRQRATIAITAAEIILGGWA